MEYFAISMSVLDTDVQIFRKIRRDVQSETTFFGHQPRTKLEFTCEIYTPGFDARVVQSVTRGSNLEHDGVKV